jgi:large subunit ribosomal protein L25
MEATLEVTRRETFGRNNAGRLRSAGQIPAVLYGGSAKTGEPLSVDPKKLLEILHSDSGVNTLIALKIEGAGDTRVLVKEYQLHPVSHHLLHADFYRVAMDKVLRVTVPVHLVGEAKGVKAQGGVVEFVNRDVTIECLPGDIPEHLTIDISNLTMNEGIRVRDLDTGGKWKPLSEGELLLVHVVAPKVEAEPAPADGALPGASAAAEPEVIKKGKTDKEDEKE